MYALLFADAGLSPAAISSLFVIWSVAGFAFELPSGLFADVFSRRRLLVAAPLLTGAGFALWTFLPSYPAFAAGFVLWGVGTALRSGTLQALVYEELGRVGAAGSYARVMGRSQALGTTAIMLANGVAAPVMAAGGYRAVGVASVVACLLCAVVSWSLPESRAAGSGAGEGDGEGSFLEVLRDGVAQVRRVPRVRGALVLTAAVMGFGALDEYLPVLGRSTGAAVAVVPLLMLVVGVGETAGGWLAGRGVRWLAPALVAAAVCMAAGALSGRPEGMALIAVAFGVIQWAAVAAEVRLQERISDRSRATVMSMAGFGSEVAAVLVFAGYALGSAWAGPGVLFAVASVPFVVMGLALWVPARR
ncbi:MFS transporter [Actinomadura rudentiformis]|uniref:MFS transporter n=1 Tax=Actinomadura rudentiformis TaxID=359158 RepID=A0A6H9Z3L0_9ACTN|nr:MFS transporter [Actinomadura rudentiformis]